MKVHGFSNRAPRLGKRHRGSPRLAGAPRGHRALPGPEQLVPGGSPRKRDVLSRRPVAGRCRPIAGRAVPGALFPAGSVDHVGADGAGSHGHRPGRVPGSSPGFLSFIGNSIMGGRFPDCDYYLCHPGFGTLWLSPARSSWWHSSTGSRTGTIRTCRCPGLARSGTISAANVQVRYAMPGGNVIITSPACNEALPYPAVPAPLLELYEAAPKEIPVYSKPINERSGNCTATCGLM